MEQQTWGWMDTENLKPLTRNLSVPLVLTLRKTLHLLQFTLLTAKMVKIKLVFFSQLSANVYFSSASGALLEEQCMVQYSVLGNQTDKCHV